MNNIQKLTSVEILEKLVSFNTVSRNSNLDLIDFVDDYLHSFARKTN